MHITYYMIKNDIFLMMKLLYEQGLTFNEKSCQRLNFKAFGQHFCCLWNIIIEADMLTSSAANHKLQVRYTSTTISEEEISLSARKRPFQRKPASSQLSNTWEKKRRPVGEQQSQLTLDVQEFQIDPYRANTNGAVKINFVDRKERQTECYNKQKDASFEGFYRPKKDSPLSPLAAKKNVYGGVSYFSKNPSTKQIENFTNGAYMEQSYPSTPNSSRLMFEQQNENSFQGNPIQTSIYSRKKQDSLLDSHQNSTPILPPLVSYTKLIRTNAVVPKNPPKLEKVKDVSVVGECTYCKNNKEMTDIMCEKYRKLQQQLSVKNEKIRQFTGKLNVLKQQHSKLNEKYQAKLQASQLREIQYFRQRQDLIARIDGYKTDLMRLTDKLKYADMQNGMLLRYKDEIQLMEKEYDMMMAENQRLQKTIAAIKRGPAPQKFKKYKGDQMQRKQQNVPYFNGFNYKHSVEDDLVSLSLSERSFEQF